MPSLFPVPSYNPFMDERTVKLFATLREMAGANELTVTLEDGATVRHLVDAVGAVCPQIREEALEQDGQLSGAVQIMINGRHVKWLDGLETKIAAKDELILMPLVGGG